MKRIWKFLVATLALSFTLGVAVACGGGGEDNPPASSPTSSGSSSSVSESTDKEITGVTFAGAEYDYDGTEKRIEVSGLPTGVTVSYTS